MQTVKEICSGAKAASIQFSAAPTSTKNAVLNNIKELILSNIPAILAANKDDLQRASERGRSDAFLDRLRLTAERIEGIALGLDAVVALPDPTGEVVEQYTLPNGLAVKKVRAPLGVVGIIFEARPNVSVDAAALCIKSGNGVVLRGSRESASSVRCLVSYIKAALIKNGISPNLCGLVDFDTREATVEMLTLDKFIDVVIPRGGEGLKKVVLENATMQVLASAGGNCHLYVAASANETMAVELALNGKVQRPSVCNALETLLIDRKKEGKFVTSILSSLQAAGVEIRGDKEVQAWFPSLKVIEEDEFYTEYEALIIKVRMVDGVEEAIAHINQFSTHHSEAIASSNQAEVDAFCTKVDSAVVYANASTRFTDGFELGLGAEMGISTQKLHVRGPIGLTELTSVKYVVQGNGQTRK